MKNKNIDWINVEVGDELQYEEKYYLQAYVTVKSKEYINDNTHSNYIKLKLQIDEIKGGTLADSFNVGDTFTVGKSLSEGQYLTNGMKFKEKGSIFDYNYLET